MSTVNVVPGITKEILPYTLSEPRKGGTIKKFPRDVVAYPWADYNSRGLMPVDAVLYWDADVAVNKELVEGSNTFNSSILPTQYVREYDGSYKSTTLNMLTNSGFVGAVSGTPGTAPTGWTAIINTASSSVDGDRITITADGTGPRYSIAEKVSILANTVYIFKLNVDALTSGLTFTGLISVTANPVGSTLVYKVDNEVVIGGAVPIPLGQHELVIVVTVGATAGTAMFRVGQGASISSPTGTVTISNPQLTEGPTARPYVKSPVSGPALGDVVDVIGGRKMLRTCGAVTNLFSGDASIARSVSLTAQAYTLQVFGAGSVTCSYGTATVGNPLTFTAIAGSVTFTPTGATLWMLTASAYPLPYTPPGTTMPASHATTTNGPWFGLPQYDDAENTKTNRVWAALDGEPDGVELLNTTSAIIINYGGSAGAYNATTKIISNNAIGSNATYPRFSFEMGVKVVGARYRCSFVFSDASKIPSIRLADSGITQALTKSGNAFIGTITADNTLSKVEVQLDGTALFSTQIISASIQRIQPQPLTLATRVMMGVGSGDLARGVFLPYLSINTALDSFHLSTTGIQANENRIVRAFDGVTPILINNDWSRNFIILRITQVNTAGTQFRVGYMIEGTHTAIQWSYWVNFDGSFGPSTLYRLMLGFNNPYPMWFSKIIMYGAQIDDAKLIADLEA